MLEIVKLKDIKTDVALATFIQSNPWSVIRACLNYAYNEKPEFRILKPYDVLKHYTSIGVKEVVKEVVK